MGILDLRYSACRELFCRTVCLIMTERSDSIIRHYSLVIIHSLKFHTSGSLRLKDSLSDRKRNYSFTAEFAESAEKEK
ncbi:hypothetical protein D1AOALGA4SA_7266, partial [Olavius algarvensis Delta 1 endosymbiont]